MEKRIELAKSWFQLAIVLATLAGMTIVAAGVFWTPFNEYADMLVKTKDICSVFIAQNAINYTFGDCLLDFSEPQLNSLQNSSEISMFLILLAVLLAINSLFFWFQGYWKMKIEEYSLRKFVLVMISFDILVFIFSYFKIF